MTFDPNVPNAGQSPGLFPAQMNTDLARLKTIINAEHVFNDTAAANDGTHRQVTLINRADPVSLPTGTSGVLYSKADSLSRTQLFFYNGSVINQITPFNELLPIRIMGSAVVSGLATQAIFSEGANWAGTGWAIGGTPTPSFNFYNLLRIGLTSDFNVLDSNTGSIIKPTLSINTGTGVVSITNNAATSATLYWSIIYNRFT